MGSIPQFQKTSKGFSTIKSFLRLETKRHLSLIDRQGLWHDLINAPGHVRDDPCLFDCLRGKAIAPHGQQAVRRDGCLKWGRTRLLFRCVSEERSLRRRCSWSRRQIQVKIGLFRNTDSRAHKPVRMSAYGHGLTLRVGSLRRDCDRQKSVAGIAVRHQRAFRQTFRRRPFDGVALAGEIAGQCDGQVHRLASVAGIFPVGVPAVFQMQKQSGLERMPRLDPVSVGYKAGRIPFACDHRTFSRRGGKGQEQSGKREEAGGQGAESAQGRAPVTVTGWTDLFTANWR